jgi:hypothetical protein
MRINEAVTELKNAVMTRGMCYICNKRSNCSRHCGEARNPGAETWDLIVIRCGQFSSIR